VPGEQGPAVEALLEAFKDAEFGERGIDIIAERTASIADEERRTGASSIAPITSRG
jgi:hypothetical protein